MASSPAASFPQFPRPGTTNVMAAEEGATIGGNPGQRIFERRQGPGTPRHPACRGDGDGDGDQISKPEATQDCRMGQRTALVRVEVAGYSTEYRDGRRRECQASGRE